MVQLGEHRDQSDGEGDVIMCQYLEWELNVDPVTLREFEKIVRNDFVGPGQYPTPTSSKTTPPPSTNPFSAQPTGMITPPSYGQWYPSPTEALVPSALHLHCV